MRKLIEQKLENAKIDLEKIEEQNKKTTSIIRDFREQRVIGEIEAYENLLNCKELSEMESKAEKYEELELNGGIAYINTKADRHNTFVKLQQENKILKEGIKALSNYCLYDNAGNLCKIVFCDLHEDDEIVNKIKAMLEVVENE